MVNDLLSDVANLRASTLRSLDGPRQARLGQFFTPTEAATLMAAMPRLPDGGRPIRLLDPGAGSGVLLAALLARVVEEVPGASVHAVAVEVDSNLIPVLQETTTLCVQWAQLHGATVEVDIRCEDLIYSSTGLGSADPEPFDVVIMNPPYAKLALEAGHRRALAALGVDCPNLYAAFLALGVLSLRPGGQLVAITPRSFANGPYFERFRRFFLDAVALDVLHTFESRSTIFSDTGVLQENIVLSGTKHGERGKVRVTNSKGHLDGSVEYLVDHDDLVHPEDPHQFLRVPARDGDALESLLARPCTLADLGLSVSTGRVVDFRARENLRDQPGEGSLPLVYPGNLRGGRVEWPRPIRKPQAFALLETVDRKALVPPGCYVLVKRFSAKEERRRIVAAVWDPAVNGATEVAFENHLNVFHRGGQGLDPQEARGLCLWLNGTVVDQHFRTFSGHTQVNATDIRTLPFPTSAALRKLAETPTDALPEQADLDAMIRDVLGAVSAA